MKRIWKWTIYPKCELDMPIGAKILSVQTQHGDVRLWALVDPTAPTEFRKFRAYGTGHEVPENPGNFIATFQLDGGASVFHLFEEKRLI